MYFLLQQIEKHKNKCFEYELAECLTVSACIYLFSLAATRDKFDCIS